jgi:hypothetical protein
MKSSQPKADPPLAENHQIVKATKTPKHEIHKTLLFTTNYSNFTNFQFSHKATKTLRTTYTKFTQFNQDAPSLDGDSRIQMISFTKLLLLSLESTHFFVDILTFLGLVSCVTKGRWKNGKMESKEKQTNSSVFLPVFPTFPFSLNLYSSAFLCLIRFIRSIPAYRQAGAY